MNIQRKRDFNEHGYTSQKRHYSIELNGNRDHYDKLQRKYDQYEPKSEIE